MGESWEWEVDENTCIFINLNPIVIVNDAKRAATLHNCIAETDEVKINEQDKSICV